MPILLLHFQEVGRLNREYTIFSRPPGPLVHSTIQAKGDVTDNLGLLTHEELGNELSIPRLSIKIDEAFNFNSTIQNTNRGLNSVSRRVGQPVGIPNVDKVAITNPPEHAFSNEVSRAPNTLPNLGGIVT